MLRSANFEKECLEGRKETIQGYLSIQRMTDVNFIAKRWNILVFAKILIKLLYNRNIRVSGRVTRVLGWTPVNVHKASRLSAIWCYAWSLKLLNSFKHVLLKINMDKRQEPWKQSIYLHQMLSHQHSWNPRQLVQWMPLKCISATTEIVQVSKIKKESCTQGDRIRVWMGIGLYVLKAQYLCI